MNKTIVPSLWAGQLFHLLCLTILLLVTWFLWVDIGSLSPFIFWLTISVPIAHQIFVWLAWRMELKSKSVSNSIGLKFYLILFFVFLIGRLVSFLFLIWKDYGSLKLGIAPCIILSVTFFIPAIYTMYSVKKYFGFVRAAGADHFDPTYRTMPLVKKGMFKYSTNSMYAYGFYDVLGFGHCF